MLDSGKPNVRGGGASARKRQKASRLNPANQSSVQAGIRRQRREVTKLRVQSAQNAAKRAGGSKADIKAAGKAAFEQSKLGIRSVDSKGRVTQSWGTKVEK